MTVHVKLEIQALKLRENTQLFILVTFLETKINIEIRLLQV